MWFKKRKQQTGQKNHVVIRNGVDVRQQAMVQDNKGYFPLSPIDETICMTEGGNIPRTVVIDNLVSGERYYRTFNRQLTIGRDGSDRDKNLLVLSGDSKISRKHCMLYYVQNRLCIQDMKSRNHTYVNEKRIEHAAFLNCGDVIRVGGIKLRLSF
ncbi:MAG: FHA domain-containing protein [Lachnospiraceae bacterium]|nr:FHA domain-containing protein [Lachnospiraceae bacterium]